MFRLCFQLLYNISNARKILKPETIIAKSRKNILLLFLIYCVSHTLIIYLIIKYMVYYQYQSSTIFFKKITEINLCKKTAYKSG